MDKRKLLEIASALDLGSIDEEKAQPLLLGLLGVSHQRELLLAYEKSQQPKTWFMSKNEAECRIDEFLANNCG